MNFKQLVSVLVNAKFGLLGVGLTLPLVESWIRAYSEIQNTYI